VALLHFVKVGHLGQHRSHQPETVGQLEAGEDAGGDQEATQLAEHPLARRLAGAGCRREGQPLGLGIGGEPIAFTVKSRRPRSSSIVSP
jgi:hypothetical protein